MQQHGSNYFARRPPPPPPLWGQNNTFSEQCHIACNYQIKRNHKCSDCPHNPHSPPPQRVKINFFQNMVMLHIKLKEMVHHTSTYPYTHPQPVGWIKR